MFRECYVTNDAINNKRSEFLRVLNWSFRKGCLQCSFSDKDLNDYIQFKRRNSLVIKKRAVQHIGRQKDGTWTLGHGLYISKKGSQINDVDCDSVWISFSNYNGMLWLLIEEEREREEARVEHERKDSIVQL